MQERQDLKDIEDQIVDILLVLDSTSDTISSVIEMYKQFCHDSSIPSAGEEAPLSRKKFSPGEGISQSLKENEFDLISFSLHEKQRDVVQHRKKVETLHVKVQGTAKLVRIQAFFFILNFQISDETNSAIQPSTSRKWKLSENTHGRGAERELCHTKAYREEHTRCRCRQGTYHHNIDISACDSCTSQSDIGILLF